MVLGSNPTAFLCVPQQHHTFPIRTEHGDGRRHFTGHYVEPRRHRMNPTPPGQTIMRYLLSAVVIRLQEAQVTAAGAFISNQIRSVKRK